MADTNDLQARRAAHDRRARAWTFATLGALGVWLSFGLTAQGGILEAAGWAVFTACLAATVYGLTLFTPPRP